jgi:ferredoxin
MRDCTCGGRNPDCYRCGGLGIYNPRAQSTPSFAAQRVAREVSCPICRQAVFKVIKHIRKVHAIVPVLHGGDWTFLFGGLPWVSCRHCGECVPESELTAHESSHAKGTVVRKDSSASVRQPVPRRRVQSPKPPAWSADATPDPLDSGSKAVTPAAVPGSREAMLTFLLRRFRSPQACVRCGGTARDGYYCVIADIIRPGTVMRIHSRCLDQLPSPYRTLISGPIIRLPEPVVIHKVKKKRKSLKVKRHTRETNPGNRGKSLSSGNRRLRGRYILPAQGQTRKPGSHRAER